MTSRPVTTYGLGGYLPGRSGGNVAAERMEPVSAPSSSPSAWIDVRDYGAAGDGATDDTVAIQAALDAVSPSLGLGVVFVPSGTYMIDAVDESKHIKSRFGGLRIRSGTTVLLARDATLKVIPNASPSYSLLRLNLVEDVTIRGGRLVGDRNDHDYTDKTYPTHEFGYGILAGGAKRLTIEGVTVSDFTGDNICIGSDGMMNVSYATYRPSEHVTIRGCTIARARRNNITCGGLDFITIENNRIIEAGLGTGPSGGVEPRFGIDIEGFHEFPIDYEQEWRILIRGNDFRGNAAAAVSNYNGYNVIIEGNFSDTWLSYGAGGKTVIANNVIETSASSGVGIWCNTGAPRDAEAVITGNVVKGFAMGMELSNKGVVATGNYVSGFATVGINIYGATDALVSGNHVSQAVGPNTATVGVRVQGSTGTTVSGNHISDVAKCVVAMHGSTAVLIDRNTLRKAMQAVRVESGCEAVIKGNDVDLTGYAVTPWTALDWSGSVLCEGNTIRNSSAVSIGAVNAPGSKSTIVGNRIINSTFLYQISVSGGSHAIIGNTVEGVRATSLMHAILIAGGADRCKVFGNTAYHSGAAPYAKFIDCAAATNTRIVGNTCTTGTLSSPGTGDVAAGNNLVS